jgi:hypothetical protein
LVCLNCQFIALEVKAPGGRLSTVQQAQGVLIRRAGGNWYVVDNLDQVKEIINGINK